MPLEHLDCYTTPFYHAISRDSNRECMSSLYPDYVFEEDDQPPIPPRFFVDKQLNQFNYSNVHILHQGVDTIKQLYKGIPHIKTYLDIEWEYKNKIGAVVNIQTKQGNFDFILGSGGKSGYTYRLQNNELGVIIFFASRYKKLIVERSGADGLPAFSDDTESYSHLKIECSPHLLLSFSHNEVQDLLDGFANVFMQDWDYSGVAAHLCVDVMGWFMPSDFEQRFRSYSKKDYTKHTGIETVELQQSETAVTYGGTQTITYGRPAFTQFTIYDKQIQALKTDKLDFWEDVWLSNSEIPELPSPYKPLLQQTEQERDSGIYNVRRFELRYHHNVIEQFSAYLAQNPSKHGVPEIKCYAQLYYWIPSLWLYGMTAYRLHYRPATKTLLDPMWTILMTQINWNMSEAKVLKRCHVSKKPYSQSIDKLIQLFMGCAISLYSRIKAFDGFDVVDELNKLTVWRDFIQVYYSHRLFISYEDFDILDSAIAHDFTQKLQHRRLAGSAVF